MNKEILLGNVRWVSYHNVLIPKTDPHFEIRLDKSDLKFLLRETRAYFIRWTSGFDSSKAYPFWWVIKDEKEDKDLKNYPAKIRYEIKRGLKNNYCYFLNSKQMMEKIDKLYNIYISAFSRYKNAYVKPLKFNEYREYFLNNPNDIWVVISKNKEEYTAYAEVEIMKESVFYKDIKSIPKYLSDYPIYCLIYNMNRYYLNERGYSYVYDGTRSIGHETNIQDWLIKKFKFRRAYCKLHVSYRYDIKIMVKTLYPLRYLFYSCVHSVCSKISVLLRHEEIVREIAKIDKNLK